MRGALEEKIVNVTGLRYRSDAPITFKNSLNELLLNWILMQDLATDRGDRKSKIENRLMIFAASRNKTHNSVLTSKDNK